MTYFNRFEKKNSQGRKAEYLRAQIHK